MSNSSAVFQTTGGAVLVGAAQSGIVNQLLSKLPSTAPKVNPAEVMAAGATELRDVFPADQLDGILVGYMAGIEVTFAITIAAVGFSFLLRFLSKWKRISTAV